MRSIKSWMVVVGLATLLSSALACGGKSCDELKKDVTNECCAGTVGCVMDTTSSAAFDSMCKEGEDQCGSSLTCSGSPSGAICTMKCSCG